MIDIIAVENFHNILIYEFGGSKGIRDKGALPAALATPYATFDQQDLYPAPIEKAAAVFESSMINHPFIHGNKRIAYLLLRLTLLDSDVDIAATEDEKYDLVIAASKGDTRFDEIRDWITAKLKDQSQ